MNRNIGKIVAILILVFGFGGLLIWKLASQVNYKNYDLTKVISANNDNGGIEDHVRGGRDAKVVIVEYADYQCEYCALEHPRINKLAEEYGDKVAFVYRNFLLDYHQNGTAAASAAEAANLQGYWKEYADILFENQSVWAYSNSSERLNVFTGYFRQVTDGKGDEEKFKTDMRSSEVSKKISFDIGAGQVTKVDGTPAFYMNGERISLSGLAGEEDFLKAFREKINAALKEAGVELPSTSSSEK